MSYRAKCRRRKELTPKPKAPYTLTATGVLDILKQYYPRVGRWVYPPWSLCAVKFGWITRAAHWANGYNDGDKRYGVMALACDRYPLLALIPKEIAR